MFNPISFKTEVVEFLWSFFAQVYEADLSQRSDELVQHQSMQLSALISWCKQHGHRSAALLETDKQPERREMAEAIAKQFQMKLSAGELDWFATTDEIANHLATRRMRHLVNAALAESTACEMFLVDAQRPLSTCHCPYGALESYLTRLLDCPLQGFPTGGNIGDLYEWFEQVTANPKIEDELDRRGCVAASA